MAHRTLKFTSHQEMSVSSLLHTPNKILHICPFERLKNLLVETTFHICGFKFSNCIDFLTHVTSVGRQRLPKECVQSHKTNEPAKLKIFTLTYERTNSHWCLIHYTNAKYIAETKR